MKRSYSDFNYSTTNNNIITNYNIMDLPQELQNIIFLTVTLSFQDWNSCLKTCKYLNDFLRKNSDSSEQWEFWAKRFYKDNIVKIINPINWKQHVIEYKKNESQIIKVISNLKNTILSKDTLNKNQYDLLSPFIESDNPEIHFLIGESLIRGKGCRKNNLQGNIYMDLAAKQDHSGALAYIGMRYKFGWDVPMDLSKAFHYFERSANQGNPDGQSELGYAYEKGEGCQKDLNKAFHYYVLAAEQGHDVAQNNLGTCYLYGYGCQIDEVKAFQYLAQSANQGYAHAIKNLEFCYKDGIGCQKDPVKAFQCFVRSVELDCKEAHLELGSCYEKGTGCEADPVKAFNHYQQIADNFPEGAIKLGFCYLEGIGCQKDPHNAFLNFKKAADKGDALAQSNLGSCYYKGVGCQVDLQKALEYFQLSAKQGNKAGIKNFKKFLTGHQKLLNQ